MKAIEVLFMFFTAIIAGDFKKAHGLTSKTWAEKNGPDALKKQFKDTPDGLSFEVDRVISEFPTEQVHLVEFKTKGKTGSAKVGLIREAWPGKRNVQGDWGVDPDNMEPILLADAKQVTDDNKPKDEPKKAPVKKPEQTGDYPQLLAKAEDMGIDVPDDATSDILKELIEAEEKPAKEVGEVKKPVPKKAPAKKPAAKKPAAKKGGK